jgi:hypothetical protein
MHILLLLLVPLALSLGHVSPLHQVIIEGVLILFLIPDLILAIRQSPPFIPTFGRDLKKMMTIAEIKKGDIVYDPGCGDGRLVFAAAAQGAKATGFEYAKQRSLFHKNSSIVYGDFGLQDYTNADVVFCYLLPDFMKKFYAKIWPQLKPGCKVVSNSFRIKDLTPAKSDRSVYLYIKD